jgi:small subunit ribosomal protein S9
MAKKNQDVTFYEGVGRRKEAVARVRLYITGKDKTVQVQGKKVSAGHITVNQKPIEEVFGSSFEQKRYLKPLELTNNSDRFAITINVTGGGKNGQLEAIIHGLARALCLVDSDEYRTTLKKEGLLTRDPRTRERRKVGTGGKARRAKQSPKR